MKSAVQMRGQRFQRSPQVVEIDQAEVYFRSVSETLQKLPHAAINEAARVLLDAYLQRRTVFLFGNGGSAALASHFACDLGKGTVVDLSERFRVMALTDNIPVMTAWANDCSYEDIFAEQLQTFLNPLDITIAISGSGNSPNILKALNVARQMGAYNIGLTGFSGGRMRALCDLCMIVPSDNMQVIEDLHLSISHCLFSIVRNGILRLASNVVTANQA